MKKNPDCTICKFYKLISGKKIKQKKKRRKTHVMLENNQKKKSKLKRNKALNTQDRADIMKIIPTWSRASLPRFHQTALRATAILKSCLVKLM